MAHAAKKRIDDWATFPGTPVPSTGRRTIADMLERQARRTPDRLALTFGERHLSYAELDAAANAMARRIAARIGGPEPVVGLCMDRGIEMVACLLGILKAGAAYLPLDPALPEARMRQIVAEARPALVIAPEALATSLAGAATPMLYLEDLRGSEVAPSGPPERHGIDETSLAYVLYTSGSTGRPKGVEVTHGSVLNVLASCRRAPGMNERDVVLALARMSFDVSVLELFLPLSCGARIVLLPEDLTRDPLALAREIERHGATVVQAPPALWQALVDTGWRGSPQLRAWSGAEALSRHLADQLLPLCGELWNCYGPTEATVVATVHRVGSGDRDVPIGRSIANVTVAILDEALRPVPDGHDGELCIGGVGVARGYRGRPELTAERFVSPSCGGPRVYRTGDLARVGADGLLRYVGRIDHQVQLRGFRVEPEEIETVLAGHPGVSACVVRPWPDAIGQNALCGYVVRHAGYIAEDVHEPDLKAFLRARLPDYMVPQRILFLSALPLTPNAKIDRAALPAPNDAVGPIEDASAEPPTLTPTERRLAAIWRLLLGPISVRAEDDFFALGGYSLMTVHLLLHIEDAFGRDLSLAELLSHASLARMAALIDGEPADAMSRRIVPIRPKGCNIPLYWLDAGPLLRPALRAVGGDYPVFGLNLAPEDQRRLIAADFDIALLASVIAGHLRELQGARPFHLGGWCRWGIVAFEVARRLEATGHPIARLIVLDADLSAPASDLRAATRRLRRWAAGRWRSASSTQAAPPPSPSFGERVGMLSATYRATPYLGGLTLIQPDLRDGADRAVRRWARMVRGPITVHRTPGDHISMVHDEHSGSLGAAIRAGLSEGDSGQNLADTPP